MIEILSIRIWWAGLLLQKNIIKAKLLALHPSTTDSLFTSPWFWIFWRSFVWIFPKYHIHGVTATTQQVLVVVLHPLPWLLIFYWKRCVFYSAGVVLQTQQVWPGFSSPGWGSRWFYHAWLTCQLLLSEAHPDWSPLCSLFLPLFIAFLAWAGVWMLQGLGWPATGTWRCVHWHLRWWKLEQCTIEEEKET